jgi:CHAT domain-containing protein
MHGKANDQNPAESGLLFVKKDTLIELLTISEISAMQLEGNELIVLSACETGKGQLQKGEGIISLSRAFAMSGSKSLILSLSEVDELAASHIMVAFLTNIQQGMHKDVALQQAKMDYVKLHPYHYLSAPGHWAPFILLGDNSAVPTRTHYGWVVLCILIGIMVLYGVTKGRGL